MSWDTTTTRWLMRNQPFLYNDSANDGFHEAIGDTMALSVTPPYLKQLGLINTFRIPARTSASFFSGRWKRSRFCRLATWWINGAGRSFREKLDRMITTGPGGSCARNIRALPHQPRVVKTISILARNTTCRQTFPIHVTSWRIFCNFNFTGRFVERPDSRVRSTNVRFMETSRQVKSLSRCWRWD